jgi:hypothetical protein
MTKDKDKGKPVRDVKGPATEEAKPNHNQVQVHAGNINVLTVQMLSEISQKLGRVATSLEYFVKEHGTDGGLK